MRNPLMSRTKNSVVLVIALAASGCASTRPVAYTGIDSSAKLHPSTTSNDRVPFEYKSSVDWRAYSHVIVEPVVIYRGPDAQFDKNVSEEDKAYLAQYMESLFSEKLGTRFTIASMPGSDTLRVKLTLTGAKDSKRVMSTFAHFDLTGGIYNATQAVRGKEAAFTGSVSYAVEIYNSSTNQLLGAYVTKQYPNSMNVKASFGRRSASITGIKKGADQLLTYFE